ncbi:MAG TPA: glycosyltransferase family 2 protein [Ignavibacteriaceae bacterium]|nr:glycosyltransferase family 2 protein [Ignavibacteriaceae bacterium]
MSRTDISVVIPVKNEEENIGELISRLTATLTSMNLNYELIFVTDINRDRTYDILKENNKKDPRIKTVKLSNGFGQYTAIMAGLNNTFGNSVVIMDGDLQDYPEDIPKLFNKMKEGFDVVYGIKQKKNDTFIRNFFSKSFWKILNKFSDYDIELNSGMFRILSKRVVLELRKFNEKQILLTGLISLIGFPTTKIEVTSGKRIRGNTKYSFFQQVNIAMNALLSFSTKPLRIISLFGLTVSGISFAILAIVFFEKVFYGADVPGWTTIVVLITFLGGAQLFGLGIVGEYIGRIFLETKDRPLYIVEDKIGDFTSELLVTETNLVERKLHVS